MSNRNEMKVTALAPYYADEFITLHHGDSLDVLRSLPAGLAQTSVTSPPYFGLRDYKLPPTRWGDGSVCCFGLEPTPELYVSHGVEIFREFRRVLKDDGTLWINIGDSYANDGKWGGSSGGKHVAELHGNSGIGRNKQTTGLKPKDLIGIPWLLAFALRADGWYLRQEIIWHKPNPMPESVTDRCTKSHEQIFMLSKSDRYFYDSEAIKIDGSGLSGGAAFGKVNKDGPGSRRISAEDNARIRGTDKQRGHVRRHNGFNARWDAMKKAEQCSGKVNRRNVWVDRDEQQLIAWIMSQPDGDAILSRYLSDSENRGDVWSVCPASYPGAHFATFPETLIEPCILAGAGPGGTVLDMFNGSGTAGAVARRLHCKYIGIELNRDYCDLSVDRWRQGTLAFPLPSLAGGHP